MELRFMEWNNEAQQKVANPYLLGTSEDVAYEKPTVAATPRAQAPSMTNQPRRFNSSQKKKQVSKEETSAKSKQLLQSLSNSTKASSNGIADDSY